MLTIHPKLTDPLGSCQDGGQEAGAAGGDNQEGPFWLIGASGSVPPILHGRIERQCGRATERPAERPNSPSGLMVVRGP